MTREATELAVMALGSVVMLYCSARAVRAALTPRPPRRRRPGVPHASPRRAEWQPLYDRQVDGDYWLLGPAEGRGDG